MAAELGGTERTTLKRMSDRASFAQSDLYSIIDDALVAHVGFVVDGKPVVIPMACGRAGNDLLLHGSSGSRLMRALAQGAAVSVSITELTGLKVSRSTFESGMNYRSAVIFGDAVLLEGEAKSAALEQISDALLPGRVAETRSSTKKELAATLAISVALTEASVKISDGGVTDDPADLGSGVWAGKISLKLVAGEVSAADEESAGLPVPESVRSFVEARQLS
jgi:nitroimidazol reductase NimA-like FMN-containing flavoprotein (pyridoxamine 5'-phosphate oxidase superfamily)